jgi:hypothetical protein
MYNKKIIKLKIYDFSCNDIYKEEALFPLYNCLSAIIIYDC